MCEQSATTGVYHTSAWMGSINSRPDWPHAAATTGSRGPVEVLIEPGVSTCYQIGK